MATLNELIKRLVQHTGRTDLLSGNEAVRFEAASNLITNGDFSGSYTGGLAPNWTAQGTHITTTELTGTSAYGGGQSQQVAITSVAENNYIYSNTISLAAGKLYRLRFALKITSGIFGRVGMFDSTTGIELMTAYDYQNETNLSFIDQTATGWNVYTYDFIAPTTTSAARLTFYNRFNTAGVWAVDAVKLAALEGGPDATWYIQQACDFLDQQQETPQQKATHVQALAVGDYLVDLLYCRAVQKVYFKVSGSDRITLNGPTRFQTLLESFTDRLEDTEVGMPTYWGLVPVRQAPEQFDETLNTTDAEYLIKGVSEDTTRIVILPPTDTAGVVIIEGLFASTRLVLETDQNWWSINKPDLVVWVAKYILEGALRSAEGMRDLMAFIQPYLVGIDKDLVEADMTDYMEMEG